MTKKSLLHPNGEPIFCLCHTRWYKPLFLNNPLLCNRLYWLGVFDPEAWLEWWYLGAPVRIYYWKRDRWIDVLSGNRRTEKLYGPIEELRYGRPGSGPQSSD